jgi:nicotinamidase-related amidase
MSFILLNENKPRRLSKPVAKKILLIIDPQTDFSDKADGLREKDGKLAVPGSTKDYANTIEKMKSEDYDEIHVSLDTHTECHIGHPAFWKVKLTETSDWEPATDANAGLTILSINAENVISGFNILTGTTSQFRPRCYDEESYPALCQYVNQYLHFYSRNEDGKCKPENKKEQSAWIWFDHCLENTDGHKVAVELQAALDSFAAQPGKMVFYHKKGQNNLAEMYSIFSAERPVPSESTETLSRYIYTGKATAGVYDNNGYQSYEAAINSPANLNTQMNYSLMDRLLGITQETPSGINTVYICGQARTHCVKSSAIDLMDYATSKGVSSERIVFLENCSSPIPGVPDDLSKIVREYGYIVA